MAQNLVNITLVVNDYDEAIDFYVNKLGFNLIENAKISDAKRWVVVRPKGPGGCGILLARAANEEQRSRIGNQTGGRVFLFLSTDNFERDYQHLKDMQIKVIRGPVIEVYGKVLVFEDLYGNRWDLIESK